MSSGSLAATSDLVASLIDGTNHLTIPIVDGTGDRLGDLQPITRHTLSDGALTACLTRWRNAAGSMFFTQFEATDEGTLAWLRDRVLTDHTRLLFVVRANTTPVGTLGFIRLSDTSAELDNLIRGERVGPASLFQYAERSLAHWLFDTFGLRKLEAAVLAGNFAALQLHRSLGFEIRTRTALKRTVAGNVTALIPVQHDEQGDGGSALHLVLDRKAFQCLEQELEN